MDKFELLEAFCAGHLKSPEKAEPVTVGWMDQIELLWPEAQRFNAWRDVAYSSSVEWLADKAILERAWKARWPELSPSISRVISSRLIQSIVVIQANELVFDRPGITMPLGLSTAGLTSALLIYWCYAMELPLVETGGTHVGRA